MGKGIKFDVPKEGFIVFKFDGKLPTYRYSTAVKLLREQGVSQVALDEFEKERVMFGGSCPIHGDLPDPVIGTMDTLEGRRTAFACPHCSSEAIRKAWEAEGHGAS